MKESTKKMEKSMNKLREAAYDAYLDKMRNAVDESRIDAETAHRNGDDILCDLLRELGFNDIVDEFELIRKWYA